MSAYNQTITIQSPFARGDLPSLFIWSKRIWQAIADDGQPDELDDWMEYQLARIDSPSLHTWGIYGKGELGGYVEASDGMLGCPENTPLCQRQLAAIRMVFKRDLWGHHNTMTALNLVLREVYEQAEIAFFPLLVTNPWNRDLVLALGASKLGTLSTDGTIHATLDLYALSSTDWEARNIQFLKEYERVHPAIEEFENLNAEIPEWEDEDEEEPEQAEAAVAE